MAALGILAQFGVLMANPGTISVTAGNVGCAAPFLQICLNGNVVAEFSDIESVDLVFDGGYNVVQLAVADGSIYFAGKIIGDLATPVSLFPLGSDLFESTGPSTGSGGAVVVPV
jgi:hypothetical protein